MNVGRALFLASGITLVGVGAVGVVVPGLPTTVFLVMALFCFKKSSPRLENWLLTHPRFGPTLRDWESDRSIKPRTKIVAIVTMWVFIGASVFMIRNLWALALILALGVFGTWYILTRKSVPTHQTENHGTAVS